LDLRTSQKLCDGLEIMPRPLILLTNDDGVKSPGLLAAASALRGLGELMVAAPREQQSSSGRAFYWNRRPARKSIIQIGRHRIVAHAVDASPAVSVRYALMLAVPRTPALVVSGINYGENLGSGLTISGTVGAALEAAAGGVPALAVSLETAKEFHTTHSKEIEFRVAGHWTRWAAEKILATSLPKQAPLVNLNVPSDATTGTRWRITRASHQTYFRSLVARGKFVGYDVVIDAETLEPDSDIYALRVAREVSVTPLTYDLTAPVNAETFGAMFETNTNGKRERTGQAR
jgi:5'-nucleotidase